MIKIIIIPFFLFLILTSCEDEQSKIIKQIKPEIDLKTDPVKSKKEIVINKKNKPKTLVKENVLEIYHSFQTNQLIGDSVKTSLENSTGAMLSAYSLDKGKYNLFYRTKNNESWSKWEQLHLNHHVNNPERKVYEATSITNEVDLLQFKSSSSTKSDVVFRLYKFEKN